MTTQEFEAKIRELRAERQKAVQPIHQAQFELKQEITAKGQQIHALFNDIDKLKVKKQVWQNFAPSSKPNGARKSTHSCKRISR